MESDRYLRITLRIPRELHARIEAEADRTSKSQNAEIVARIEESFQEKISPMTDQRLNELLDRVGRNQDLAMSHVEMLRDLLARGIVELADDLPADLREREEYEQIIEVARAVINDDTALLAKILRSRIKGSDPELVKSAAKLWAASNTTARRKGPK